MKRGKGAYAKRTQSRKRVKVAKAKAKKRVSSMSKGCCGKCKC